MTASTATLNMVMKAKDKASGKLKGVAGSLGKVAAVAGGAVVAGLGAATVAATKLAMDSAKIEGVRNTFKSLADTIDADVAESMNQLRDASRGMVSDFDLMQGSNKFVAMGLADSSEEAAKLTEIATQLGTAMGEDATISMENFALMMANQSIPRLDSFGISSGKVRERIKELMDANEGMTRETAFMQATMEEAEKTMEKVGKQGEGTGATVARLRAKIKNIKDTFGNALLPILDKVLNAVMPLVDAFGDWAEEVLPSLISRAQEFMGGVDFASIFEKLSNWFATWGPVIWKYVKQIWDVFSEFAQGMAANIIPWILAQVDKIKVWFEENRPLIEAFVQKVIDIWKKIAPQIIAFWSVVEPILSALITIVLDIGKIIMQMVTGDWKGAWETAKGIVKTAWEAIKEAWMAFVDWVAGWFGTSWEGIKQTWKENWDNFKLIVSTVWDKIKTTIREKLVEAVQKIKNFMSNFRSAGRNLITGLWEGVRNRINEFIWFLRNKLWEVINLTRRIFQNRSPSKVFAGIGENLMAGLAEGIEGGIRMPEVALQGMAANITTTASNVQPQPATRSLTIENVHINNGMDFEEFRAMLRRTLNG